MEAKHSHPCAIQIFYITCEMQFFNRVVIRFPKRDTQLFLVLAGQITRRVAPSVAPSTGCSIIILILFFRVNIVH